MEHKSTGSQPFRFRHREDLRTLPGAALSMEERLHGGFGVDGRDGHGQLYYGLPGHGMMPRLEQDEARLVMSLIALPRHGAIT